MTIWGYILDMPGRPTPERQREALTLLGAGENIFQDQLEAAKRHPTAGLTQLVNRNELIASVSPGDRVFVAGPMCLGVSPKDADVFMRKMTDRGVAVIVPTGDFYVVDAAAGQMSKVAAEVVEEFTRQRSRYAAAKSRGRA